MDRLSEISQEWLASKDLLFQHGESLYNFQGLRRFKERFDPIWEPTYLASPGGWCLPRITAEVTQVVSERYRGKCLGKTL